MRKILAVLLGLALTATTAIAQSGPFPSRPLKVVVPFGTGSGVDTTARYFADRLAGSLGQPVVVENRPGASGVIGTMAVKNAPADGYTILLGSVSNLSVNPIAVKDLPYDPARDFKPIHGLTQMTSVLIVPAASPHRTLGDLIGAAKTGGRPLNMGTYSTAYELAVHWFAGMAGVAFTNVPYKGAAPTITDVMGGQLDFAIADLAGVAQLLKAGKLRGLAVSTERRDAQFPELPTIAESGFPGYENRPWMSYYIRTETPDDVSGRLTEAMRQILATNEARQYARQTVGNDLLPLGPDAMRAYHLAEMERFRKIAERSGIKAQ